MAGIFDIKVVGLAPVDGMMVQLANFGGSKMSLLRALGVLIQKQHTRRVLSEKTSPDGATWAPLKASTVERKGNANILVESGRMAHAWSLAFGADSVRMRNTATSSRSKGVKYLPFHQFGTRNMAARPMLGLSAANEREIHEVVNAWVARRIGIAA